MINKKLFLPFFCGYFLIIIGALLCMLNINFGLEKTGFWIFCAGALLNIIFRFLLLPRSENKRIRRLNNQQFLIVILLVITGYLMWIENNAWVISLLVCAVVEFWISFRYSEK
ncbi:MAG: hypothetical protein LBS50_06115 [Prevotellaceae bacterium]|jgi:hypothetical protein|nr:hypothetical protein [Prevotellaceae bacterium]